MKISKWYLVILVSVVIFSPLHWYSKWQLKHFEYGGFLGFIAAVFYTPSDYRDVVWSGMLHPNETYALRLSHNYLGLHEVRVVREITESSSSFELILNCDSGFSQQFQSDDMGKLKVSNSRKNPEIFGGYQVSDFSNFESCEINIKSDSLEGPVFVYFRTGYPL